MTGLSITRIIRVSQKSLRLLFLTGFALFTLACRPQDTPGPACSCSLPDDVQVRLCPVSEEQARETAFYARQTQLNSSVPTPISWSKLNSDCEKRMVVVQYVFAAGKDPSGIPLVLQPENFSEANLKRLASNPVIDVKGVLVFGTLGATQRLLNYDRTPASLRTRDVGWSSHYITLVNIQGICKVIDLSIGDEPIGIDAWLSGFYNGTCTHEGNAGCNYSIIEPFTAAILNDPTKIPAELTEASNNFLKELADDFDIHTATINDLPWYLTEYTALAP